MRRIAFIGPPNVGKSSLFARVTGVYVPVGNWAGMTVSVNQAKVLWCGKMLEVLDLPGFYALNGGSEDEKIAQQLVDKTQADVWLVVLDAVHLPKQIALLHALLMRNLPVVVLINQIDEAKRLGIQIDSQRLQTQLGIPVLQVSGRDGGGVSAIQETVCQFLVEPKQVNQPALARHAQWLDEVWHAPSLLSDSVSERLDALFLHPVWGLPLFALMMVVLFQAVFWLGGGMQSWLADGFDWLQQSILQPLLADASPWISGLLLDGLYNGVATLVSFVPLVGIFFFLLASLNDSGYLARMAFLADGLMARFGLEGRSLVLTVMGMGCNVPAILGARIIPDRRIRLLTQMMLPFSLCSARLQVFVFIAAALFAPWQAAFVVLAMYAMSVLAALLTAWLGQKVMPASVSLHPVVIEMPAYRIPHWSMALRAAIHEVREFVRRASGLIIFGVVALWLLLNLPVGVTAGDTSSYAAQLSSWLAPIFSPMGLPHLYVLALLFGLVAKEVVLGGLMVLLGVSDAGLAGAVASSISPISAIALMVFVLLYTPCLATLSVLRQEGGWRLMLSSLAWSLSFAWLAAVFVYQVLHWLFG
ncbi:MAG: ferrous iron transport protein B [Proteobacteria bacterium]|nr:ferrous iron transport protein B [Pseudomonadota bacterium]